MAAAAGRLPFAWWRGRIQAFPLQCQANALGTWACHPCQRRLSLVSLLTQAQPSLFAAHASEKLSKPPREFHRVAIFWGQASGRIALSYNDNAAIWSRNFRGQITPAGSDQPRKHNAWKCVTAASRSAACHTASTAEPFHYNNEVALLERCRRAPCAHAPSLIKVVVIMSTFQWPLVSCGWLLIPMKAMACDGTYLQWSKQQRGMQHGVAVCGLIWWLTAITTQEGAVRAASRAASCGNHRRVVVLAHNLPSPCSRASRAEKSGGEAGRQKFQAGWTNALQVRL